VKSKQLNRFKCLACKARGNTLVESDEGFVCSACGHTEPEGFWETPFELWRDAYGDQATVREAAELLGMTESGVRRAILEGHLGARRIGRRALLINLDELVEFAKNKRGKRVRAAKDAAPSQARRSGQAVSAALPDGRPAGSPQRRRAKFAK
jgi:excisionase family DNA binding protein